MLPLILRYIIFLCLEVQGRVRCFLHCMVVILILCHEGSVALLQRKERRLRILLDKNQAGNIEVLLSIDETVARLLLSSDNDELEKNYKWK